MGWRAAAETPRETVFRPLRPPGQNLVVLPESERPFRRLVIGLSANQTRYFMLPSTEPFDPGSRDPRVRFIRRQSYWLNFELLHGRIMKAIPAYTRVFVAVPDPRTVPGSLGNEEDVFRDYLHRRVGWSEEEIAKRVRFFAIPGEIPFPQDLAEPLGTDDRGRLVLAIGGDIADVYREPVLQPCKGLPRRLRDPDRRRHRRQGRRRRRGRGRVFGLAPGRELSGCSSAVTGCGVTSRTRTPWPPRRPRRSQNIEEAREAFRRAFFGVETIIVGEDGLLRPSLVSEELFHTDMIVNVLRAHGKTLAFVPSYQAHAVDAITHVALAEEVRRRVQYEYDIVAGQLARRGYEVVRLPFADHPVRNPVNVGRFVDPNTGRQCVLLGKYPYHFPLVPGGPIAQFEVQDAFDRLDDAVGSWHHAPTEANWGAVEQAFRGAWAAMDKAAESVNPIFDEQAKVYSSHGITVIPVAIFPTGEGGLHCLAMS